MLTMQQSSRFIVQRVLCRRFCTTQGVNNAENMSELALKNGEPLPTVRPDLMRIYSMRFCPFAQRTRIVLLHKNIPHEIVNVNLRHKPDWFLARNPLGLVPVLEHRGHVVYESAVCDNFLDSVYPQDGEGRLTKDDPIQRSNDEMLMSFFDAKVPSSIYGLRKPERAEKSRAALKAGLTKLEQNLGSQRFFGGDKPSMVDFHVYPWFERFPAVKELTTLSGADFDPLPPSEFPNLASWVPRIQSLPAVKATMFSKAHHMEFQMSFAQKSPEYDIGLEQARNAAARL